MFYDIRYSLILAFNQSVHRSTDQSKSQVIPHLQQDSHRRLLRLCTLKKLCIKACTDLYIRTANLICFQFTCTNVILNHRVSGSVSFAKPPNSVFGPYECVQILQHFHNHSTELMRWRWSLTRTIGLYIIVKYT